MRRAMISVMAAVLMAGSAIAQETGIRSTISQQFDAFRADDFAGAFAFASPDLQLIFRSPENFRRMVTQGYPMVWKYRDVKFLELAEVQGDWWQKVMVTDTAGEIHILAYRMLKTPDGWRISGVQILETPGASV